MSDSPVAHQRLVRPCRCKFQKKSDWGYIIFEWVGEPKYWRPYARRRRLPLAEAKKRARKYKHVLITCGGCGADVVREYGPNLSEPENIDSVFNACQHRGYCMKIKAELAEAKAVNQVLWRAMTAEQRAAINLAYGKKP